MGTSAASLPMPHHSNPGTLSDLSLECPVWRVHYLAEVLADSSTWLGIPDTTLLAVLPLIEAGEGCRVTRQCMPSVCKMSQRNALPNTLMYANFIKLEGRSDGSHLPYKHKDLVSNPPLTQKTSRGSTRLLPQLWRDGDRRIPGAC